MPKVAGNMFKILSNVSLYYTAKEKKDHKQGKKTRLPLNQVHIVQVPL